ncbi:MAG TPA: hypothetical protein VFS43_39555 [Polyangiaceae bacterium]|nr:hypothetical protein [Polyangiaceae bacterium]
MNARALPLFVRSLSVFCALTLPAGVAFAAGPEWFEPAGSKEPTKESAPAAADEGADEADEAPAAKPEVEAPKAPPARPAAAPAAAPRAPARAALAPAPKEREWYGWQTLLVDAAASSVYGVAVATRSEAINWVAQGGYLAGAPLVHASRGRYGVAAASLGLRAFAPLVGAWVGDVAADGRCGYEIDLGWSCAAKHRFAGAFLGAVVASVTDAALLARREAPAKPKVSLAPTVAPTVAPARQGATLGLSGTF